MITKEIEDEFNNFVEFPDGRNGGYVTCTSAKLFAQHMLEKRDTTIQELQKDLELTIKREKRYRELAENYAELRSMLGFDEDDEHGDVYRKLLWLIKNNKQDYE